MPESISVAAADVQMPFWKMLLVEATCGIVAAGSVVPFIAIVDQSIFANVSSSTIIIFTIDLHYTRSHLISRFFFFFFDFKIRDQGIWERVNDSHDQTRSLKNAF